MQGKLASEGYADEICAQDPEIRFHRLVAVLACTSIIEYVVLPTYTGIGDDDVDTLGGRLRDSGLEQLDLILPIEHVTSGKGRFL